MKKMITLTIKQIVEQKINLFDFEYPIFNENYRKHLEQMIIDNFYFREIGVETIGRFKHNLKTRLNLIMPYYNKIYETDLLEQRILDNYDVTETFTKTVKNKTIQNTSSSADNINKMSDTPQGRINLEDTSHITQLNVGKGNSEDSLNADNEGSESWSRKMTGNIGIQTDADAIIKYRQSLLKVDLMVLNELNDLFLGVYNL